MENERVSIPSSASEGTTSPQPTTTNYHEIFGDTPRPRQRAFLACIECRWRKRRCDVSLKGSPCTVCREHGRTCVVKRRQRRPCRSSNAQDANVKVPKDGHGVAVEDPDITPALDAVMSLDRPVDEYVQSAALSTILPENGT